MAINDIFATIDDNASTEATTDRTRYDNDTYSFPEGPEISGQYFILNDDERFVDKVNHNFLHSGSDTYIIKDYHYTAAKNEFIFADTSRRDAQVDEIHSINVLEDTLYSTTINGTPSTYRSSTAQIDTISSVTVANSQNYEVTVDGTSALYTSNASTSQIDNISAITVANSQAYEVTVDGSSALYTSIAAEAQESLLDTLVNTDNTDYTIVINGFSSTFTSGTGDSDATILLGIENAINTNANINTDVTATAVTSYIDVISDIPGDTFSISVSSGGITASTPTPAVNATLSQILAGLSSALDALGNVSSTENGSVITITYPADGIDYSTLQVQGTMTISTPTPATNATLLQIITGMDSAIDALGQALTVSNNGSVITIEQVSPNIGTGFTIVNVQGGMTLATPTPNVPASEADILSGLNTSINGSVEPISSLVNASKIVITANIAGIGYSLSTDINSTNTNITPNFDGSITFTLPTNPANFDIVTIFDYTNTFSTSPVTITSPNNIMGSSSDIVLNINNSKTRFIAINNDWRLL